MLTLRSLKENTEDLIVRLERKGVAARAQVRAILEIDASRRALQARLDGLQAELNAKSKEIGALMQRGARDAAAAMRDAVARLKDEVKRGGEELAQIEQALQAQLVQLPNAPHASVPEGRGAEDNMVIRMAGEVPTLPAGSLPHWEVAARLGIIDFEMGVKLTGSGFPLYVGMGARLERALINFFLDENARAGYTEMHPPILVNASSAYATGQLPDKEGQMYHVGVDDLYLIPTAEVPLTNVVRDTLLEEKQLPLRMTAYTPCFRREAGSYGKDVRGLNRLHQFDKVEIVCIEKPERSYDRLEEMLQHVEHLLQKLELPYRVLKLCSGDMSFTSAMTYDLEVYSAAQARWLEVSSVSNFEEFQANRLQVRYRDVALRRNVLAHTLNGSALALPRIVAALLENNQTARGVRLPAALVPWVGSEELAWR